MRDNPNPVLHWRGAHELVQHWCNYAIRHICTVDMGIGLVHAAAPAHGRNAAHQLHWLSAGVLLE